MLGQQQQPAAAGAAAAVAAAGVAAPQQPAPPRAAAGAAAGATAVETDAKEFINKFTLDTANSYNQPGEGANIHAYGSQYGRQPWPRAAAARKATGGKSADNSEWGPRTRTPVHTTTVGDDINSIMQPRLLEIVGRADNPELRDATFNGNKIGGIVITFDMAMHELVTILDPTDVGVSLYKQFNTNIAGMLASYSAQILQLNITDINFGRILTNLKNTSDIISLVLKLFSVLGAEDILFYTEGGLTPAIDISDPTAGDMSKQSVGLKRIGNFKTLADLNAEVAGDAEVEGDTWFEHISLNESLAELRGTVMVRIIPSVIDRWIEGEATFSPEPGLVCLTKLRDLVPLLDPDTEGINWTSDPKEDAYRDFLGQNPENKMMPLPMGRNYLYLIRQCLGAFKNAINLISLPPRAEMSSYQQQQQQMIELVNGVADNNNRAAQLLLEPQENFALDEDSRVMVERVIDGGTRIVNAHISQEINAQMTLLAIEYMLTTGPGRTSQSFTAIIEGMLSRAVDTTRGWRRRVQHSPTPETLKPVINFAKCMIPHNNPEIVSAEKILTKLIMEATTGEAAAEQQPGAAAAAEQQPDQPPGAAEAAADPQSPASNWKQLQVAAAAKASKGLKKAKKAAKVTAVGVGAAAALPMVLATEATGMAGHGVLEGARSVRDKVRPRRGATASDTASAEPDTLYDPFSGYSLHEDEYGGGVLMKRKIIKRTKRKTRRTKRKTRKTKKKKTKKKKTRKTNKTKRRTKRRTRK